MIILKSPSRDPAFNLELEKRLLEEGAAALTPGGAVTICGESKAVGEGGDALLFYINSPSVIVGRNQCIEAEADVEWCAARGIPILRRISGGGAVWHDEGNINFSFITGSPGERSGGDVAGGRSLLDSDRLAPVVAALAALGVEATVGSRRELLVGGRKISGTASFQGRRRQLFHGTLLHAADLAAMDKALRGDPARRGKKIASNPGRVMNLNTLPGLDAISTEAFLDRLVALLSEASAV